MRSHHSLSKDEDANAAANQALRGAVVGATKWGVTFAGLAVAGHLLSPIYRGLTIPFKVFIQMSGMTLGGMIEADRRVRRFEHQVRLRHRAERDHGIWRAWEEGLVEGGGGGARAGTATAAAAAPTTATTRAKGAGEAGSRTES